MTPAEEIEVIRRNDGRCRCQCIPEMVERFGDKAHGPPCRGGGGLCWSCKFIRRCDAWRTIDFGDDSTLPTREGRAEMYRGGGPLYDRVVGMQIVGDLRYIPDANTPGRHLWAIVREVTVFVEEFPDDLPVPDLPTSEQCWVIWRYLT